MSALPYHKRYHGDALTGFMALNLEQRGAYQTLLDMIYDRGGPIDDNERLLAGYMNCGIRKWRIIRAQLLEKGKIAITENGQITNFRAEKVIENQSKTHRKLIEAGAKGGRTRAENEKNPNENKEREQAMLKPASSDAQATRARPEARSQNLEEINNQPLSTASHARASPPPDDRSLVRLVDIEFIGEQARILAGLPKLSANDEIQLRFWFGDGIPPETILETIRAVMANTDDHTSTLRRFDKPIRKEHAKTLAGPAKANGGARYVSESGFVYRGTPEQVMSEALKRSDNDTYYRVRADLDKGLEQ